VRREGRVMKALLKLVFITAAKTRIICWSVMARHHHLQEGRNGAEGNIDCKVFSSLAMLALADVV